MLQSVGLSSNCSGGGWGVVNALSNAGRLFVAIERSRILLLKERFDGGIVMSVWFWGEGHDGQLNGLILAGTGECRFSRRVSSRGWVATSAGVSRLGCLSLTYHWRVISISGSPYDPRMSDL